MEGTNNSVITKLQKHFDVVKYDTFLETFLFNVVV